MASMISGCEICKTPGQANNTLVELLESTKRIQYRIEISKNIKQCKILPMCAVHYIIIMSE